MTDGKNADLWSFSLTSFTCVFTVVTIRIVNWTRWWTWVNFVFYSVFSICVYASYIWVSEAMGITSDIFVATTHKSPLFWLTLLFVGGTVFITDYAYSYYKYTDFKDGSDKIRGFIVDKRNEEGFDPDKGNVNITTADQKELEDFIEPIRMRYRKEELAREEQLSKTREAKA